MFMTMPMLVSMAMPMCTGGDLGHEKRWGRLRIRLYSRDTSQIAGSVTGEAIITTEGSHFGEIIMMVG